MQRAMRAEKEERWQAYRREQELKREKTREARETVANSTGVGAHPVNQFMRLVKEAAEKAKDQKARNNDPNRKDSKGNEDPEREGDRKRKERDEKLKKLAKDKHQRAEKLEQCEKQVLMIDGFIQRLSSMAGKAGPITRQVVNEAISYAISLKQEVQREYLHLRAIDKTDRESEKELEQMRDY
jgi:hypothetical protein